jgi:GT2 family glycosyltransferase
MCHLFGPVDKNLADHSLKQSRAQGECLAFGSDVDLSALPEASWQEVESKFPSGWRPEYVAVWLAYQQVPAWVWTAPVPVIGLAADWNLLWHSYSALLPRCDVVLTDEAGVEVMLRADLKHAHFANLYGLEWEFLNQSEPEGPRDIDVLFVGNLSATVQGSRLPWLARIAQLADRHSVVIATRTFGDEYRDLLGRSKIAFNRSIRGECNKRTFEAPAMGCLLFQEAENREVRQWLTEGEEYVGYTDDNLERLLEQFLADEPKRQAIAAAGRARVQRYGFEQIWDGVIERLQADWPAIQQRAASRAQDSIPLPKPLPAYISATLDARDLGRSGQLGQAIGLARQALTDLERPSTDIRVLNEVQPWLEFDLARVEWERAAWSHVGDPNGEAFAKRELLRWRLHVLLASLTDDLAHHAQAVIARPDLFYSRAAFGCALGRAGRVGEALDQLQHATQANPFDLEAARAQAQIFKDLDEKTALTEFTRRYRLLSKSALGIVPRQSWFADANESNGLVSIVILCCNEVEVTRVCLESIRRHTRAPYELILIDNGSTDATPEVLKQVGDWLEPVRVEVVRNEKNLGYPAGVNQGLAESRGEWIVLLNNDTAVTPNWLQGLIQISLAEGGPALVGPVTNNAPPPQLLTAGYADLSGLDQFAVRRSSEFGKKFLAFDRLTGFCLLIPRVVLDRIGGMDERYGAGFFDDDDLCIRVRKLRLPLRVALGVYIHHEGSRTFRALGINTSSLLEENLGKFRDKWGDEAAAPYRRPEPVKGLEPGISLTMIVKNEEHNLADCLSCVRDLVDEIVIADTGSTDRTKEIAASFGAKVVDFPWIDHFAAARNEALKHATRRWVFWMDADDRLDDANRVKLKQLLANLPDSNAAFSMKCRCLGKDSESVVDHVRLFRNDPRHRWTHRVHEQILPALHFTQAEKRFADVELKHLGYADPEMLRRKGERNLRLLLMEYQDQPHHPYTLFNLGNSYLELGKYAESLKFLRESIAASDPGDSIVRKLYVLVARCHQGLGQPAEAIAACVEGRKYYPDDAELLFTEGAYRRDNKDLAMAEVCFRRLIDGREEGKHFGSVNAGLRGHIGRHHLAMLLHEQKRYAEAESQWRVALTENPDYQLAWLGLGEMYIKSANWTALQQVIDHFGDSVDGVVLRGRMHLGKKEFATARWVLSQAMEQFPQSLFPRVFLSHALLQEGKDWMAAERVLRSVLEMDAGNTEAQNNLRILLDQQRRSA